MRPLAGSRGINSGSSNNAASRKRQIDPPALGLRIKSVDELGEFRLHIGPAGADRVSGILGQAGVAVGAAPDRIDQQEFDRRNDGEPQQQDAHDGEQDVGRRIEQAGAQEADKAGGLDRRGALGDKFLPDKGRSGDIAHAPRLRPIRHP